MDEDQIIPKFEAVDSCWCLICSNIVATASQFQLNKSLDSNIKLLFDVLVVSPMDDVSVKDCMAEDRVSICEACFDNLCTFQEIQGQIATLNGILAEIRETFSKQLCNKESDIVPYSRLRTRLVTEIRKNQVSSRGSSSPTVATEEVEYRLEHYSDDGPDMNPFLTVSNQEDSDNVVQPLLSKKKRGRESKVAAKHCERVELDTDDSDDDPDWSPCPAIACDMDVDATTVVQPLLPKKKRGPPRKAVAKNNDEDLELHSDNDCDEDPDWNPLGTDAKGANEDNVIQPHLPKKKRGRPRKSSYSVAVPGDAFPIKPCEVRLDREDANPERRAQRKAERQRRKKLDRVLLRQNERNHRKQLRVEAKERKKREKAEQKKRAKDTKGEISDKVDSEGKDSQGRIQCECRKIFKSKETFDAHLERQGGECKRKIPLPLNSYFDRTQKKIHRYVCGQCGQKYRSPHHLGVHIKVKHTEGFAALCEYCSKPYATKWALKNHQRVTHPEEFLAAQNNAAEVERLKSLYCEICNKTFATSASRRYHEGRHRESYKFICAVCGSGWMTSAELESHSYTHAAFKKYKCETCDCSFDRLSRKERHMRVKHGGVVEERKTLKCDQCEKTFYQACHLARHLDTIHRDPNAPKENSCEYCNVSCVLRSNLHIHSRTQRHRENVAARGLTDLKSGLKFAELRSFRAVATSRGHQLRAALLGRNSL